MAPAVQARNPRLALLLTLLVTLPTALFSSGILTARSAQALELFDGRIQAHGFYEMQFRTINEDFSENWDVTQWYNVFDLELEFDLIQDTTWGIDMMSAFVRLEVRYDCIYSRGCGMFRSMNTFGNRSQSLPRRISNGNDEDVAGELFISEGDRLSGGTTDPVPLEDLAGFRIVADTDEGQIYERGSGVDPVAYPNLGGGAWFNSPSPGDNCLLEGDVQFVGCWPAQRPFNVIFDKFKDFRFTQMERRTGAIRRMGPWLPKNEWVALASLSDAVNPFDSTALNPILFRGGRDADGNKEDLIVTDPSGFLPNLDRDDAIEVAISLDFGGDLTGALDEVVIPLVGVLDFGLDVDGDGRYTNDPSTTMIAFPAVGSEGSGSKPMVPIPIVDADGAHTMDKDLTPEEFAKIANLDLTGSCSESGDSRSCYFKEIDATVEWQRNSLGGWEVSDNTGFNVALSEEYRQRQERLVKSCGPGDLGCFAQSFTEDMIDGGSTFTCTGAACDGVTLDSVVLEAFEEVKDLGCLESEWDCADLAIPVIESKLDALDAAATTFAITCPNGISCDTNHRRAMYFARYGSPLVVSSTRSFTSARGNFIPTPQLEQLIRSGELEDLPLNFTQNQRQWNRGASQQDEKELKEAYIDAEFLDSRLWLRIGKQSIVWGKTELFRTTDQFNPQDLALATLPSLEESRIALWAFRAVYSLYEIGPLDDVRLELAFNYDDFESNDFGACGEPYAFNVVCELSLGAFVHGMSGVGIVGADTPPDPWSSFKGWEVGGRVEWRYGRFSFALTDYWGFADLPTVEFVSQFTRNVDPSTGRPRRMGTKGGCSTQDPITQRTAGDYVTDASIAFYTNAVDNGLVDPACLRPGPTDRQPYMDFLDAGGAVQTAFSIRENPGSPQVGNIPGISPATPFPSSPVNNTYRAFMDGNALDAHHANLNFFTWVCSSTVGILSLDPTACAATVFSSGERISNNPLSLVIGGLLGGNRLYQSIITTNRNSKDDDLIPINPLFMVLHEDTQHFRQGETQPSDQLDYGCLDPTSRESISDASGTTNLVSCGGWRPNNNWADGKLGKSLTPEQEALLGCGPFWGTNCDYSGIGLLNAEASALLQSFAGIEGTTNSLDLLQERVSDELERQGRDRKEIEISYFRTDGWLPILEKEGIDLDDDGDRIYGFQPGTAPFREAGLGGPLCTTNDLEGHKDGTGMLPGCRGLLGRPQTDPLTEMSTLRIDGWLLSAPVGFNRIGYSDEVGYYVDPDFYLFHPYDPTGQYEAAVCKPNGTGQCSQNLRDQYGGNAADVPDTPDLHNQWDEGYDLNVDGNPFPIRIGNKQGSRPSNPAADNRNLLRHAGNLEPSSFNPAQVFLMKIDGRPSSINEINWRNNQNDRATPTCPNCPTTTAGFREHDWSEWFPHTSPGSGSTGTRNGFGAGHPFTGDVFASELAALSFNFMMLLVSFDGDTQKIIQTLGGGPVGSPQHQEPNWYIANNCHPTLQPGGFGNPNPPLSSPVSCGAERRRFVSHYLMSGDDWGTHERPLNFADGSQNCDPDVDEYCWRDTTHRDQGQSQIVLDYDYTQNRFVGIEILEPETRVGTGEFIQAGAHCSFVTPQNCELVQNFFATAGVQHRTRMAGGNGEFGRRTFIWHSGGEAILDFDRRNVLGFATDFAEDFTKSNWGVEFTWIGDQRIADYGSVDGLSEVEEFNLTVSMDRPTFINFLNPNNTFFLNTQWFIQYRQGYRDSMPANGPWNFLGLFLIQTGYFQDRLLPSAIFVYDFKSNSGAALPQITYRYSENFSVTFGASIFMGREQLHDMPIRGVGPSSNQRGKYAYQVPVENALSLARDRDEVFMRLRYTF